VSGDLIKIITFPEIATHDWFYNDQATAVGVFGKSRVNKIDGGPMTISIAAQITGNIIIIMIHTNTRYIHNQKSKRAHGAAVARGQTFPAQHPVQKGIRDVSRVALHKKHSLSSFAPLK
jgi:hypothetical protein